MNPEVWFHPELAGFPSQGRSGPQPWDSFQGKTDAVSTGPFVSGNLVHEQAGPQGWVQMEYMQVESLGME